MTEDIRKRMFREMEQKTLFERAKSAAFSYADGARERNVFPTPLAIAQLDQFDAALPEEPTDAVEIIQQLHEFFLLLLLQI